MPVLPVSNSVSALSGKLRSSYQSPCGALLVGVVLRRRNFVLSLCIPPLLRWLLLSYVLNELGRKRSWTWPMSSGWCILASTIKCISWIWLFVPKGWSLSTPLLRQQLSALLHLQILTPFIVAWIIGLGVLRDCMDSLSSPCFPWGRFFYCPMVIQEVLKNFCVFTFPNTVNWSTSWDKNTGCTAMTIWCSIDPSTAMYILIIAWFCRNLSVMRDCSWVVPIVRK